MAGDEILTPEVIREKLENLYKKSEPRHRVFIFFCHHFDPGTQEFLPQNQLEKAIGLAQPTISGHFKAACEQLGIPYLGKDGLSGDELKRRNNALMRYREIILADNLLASVPVVKPIPEVPTTPIPQKPDINQDKTINGVSSAVTPNEATVVVPEQSALPPKEKEDDVAGPTKTQNTPPVQPTEPISTPISPISSNSQPPIDGLESVVKVASSVQPTAPPQRRPATIPLPWVIGGGVVLAIVAGAIGALLRSPAPAAPVVQTVMVPATPGVTVMVETAPPTTPIVQTQMVRETVIVPQTVVVTQTVIVPGTPAVTVIYQTQPPQFVPTQPSTATPIPANTPTPELLSTNTPVAVQAQIASPSATAIPSVPTAVPATTAPTANEALPTVATLPKSVNLLADSENLPGPWVVKGSGTYWQAYFLVQDEQVITIRLIDCGDDEGNGRLDGIQVFDPKGAIELDEPGCSDVFSQKINRLTPGWHRMVLIDKDTGSNGGEIRIEGLKLQMVFKDPADYKK